MSTKRVKASAFDQYKAVMDERGVPYQIADNGTMIVGLADGVQIIYPRGYGELGSVFVACDPLNIRTIDVKTLVPPTARKAVPDA